MGRAWPETVANALGGSQSRPGKLGARGERKRSRVKGREAYCILGYRVPATSVGERGEGAKGSEAYCILGFMVPTTSGGKG